MDFESIGLWLGAQLGVALVILVIILPIIFPFSKVKRWVSQLYIVVVTIVLLRENFRELYFLCDLNNHVGAGTLFGIAILEFFSLLMALVFMFNIIVALIRKTSKRRYLDIALLLMLIFLLFYVNDLYEKINWEFGCENLEPLGSWLLVK